MSESSSTYPSNPKQWVEFIAEYIFHRAEAYELNYDHPRERIKLLFHRHPDGLSQLLSNLTASLPHLEDEWANYSREIASSVTPTYEEMVGNVLRNLVTVVALDPNLASEYCESLPPLPVNGPIAKNLHIALGYAHLAPRTNSDALLTLETKFRNFFTPQQLQEFLIALRVSELRGHAGVTTADRAPMELEAFVTRHSLIQAIFSNSSRSTPATATPSKSHLNAWRKTALIRYIAGLVDRSHQTIDCKRRSHELLDAEISTLQETFQYGLPVELEQPVKTYLRDRALSSTYVDHSSGVLTIDNSKVRETRGFAEILGVEFDQSKIETELDEQVTHYRSLRSSIELLGFADNPMPRDLALEHLDVSSTRAIYFDEISDVLRALNNDDVYKAVGNRFSHAQRLRSALREILPSPTKVSYAVIQSHLRAAGIEATPGRYSIRLSTDNFALLNAIAGRAGKDIVTEYTSDPALRFRVRPSIETLKRSQYGRSVNVYIPVSDIVSGLSRVFNIDRTQAHTSTNSDHLLKIALGDYELLLRVTGASDAVYFDVSHDTLLFTFETHTSTSTHTTHLPAFGTLPEVHAILSTTSTSHDQHPQEPSRRADAYKTLAISDRVKQEYQLAELGWRVSDNEILVWWPTLKLPEVPGLNPETSLHLDRGI